MKIYQSTLKWYKGLNNKQAVINIKYTTSYISIPLIKER